MCRSWYGMRSPSASAMRSRSASGLCSERTSWKTAARRRYDWTSASERAGLVPSESGFGRSATSTATVLVISVTGTARPAPFGGYGERPSAEEIVPGRHDQIRGRAGAGDGDPADDRSRDPLGLAHDQLRRRRDLVGERDHGGVELVARRVVDPAHVAQDLDPR